MTKERADAGFQIGFHAIGDKGVQMALDAFASTGGVGTGSVRTGRVGTGISPVQAERSSADSTDHRFRIEHAQVTTAAQIAKFKQLKVIASMQPNHLLTDMNWAMDRLGPKRAATSYACLGRITRLSQSRHFADFTRPSLVKAKMARKNTSLKRS